MKEKILIGIVILFILGLGVESFYLVQLANMAKEPAKVSVTFQRPMPSAQEIGPSDMNRIFQTGERPGHWIRSRFPSEPPVDIKETKADFIVTADVPGMSKEQISVEIKDNSLVISGERKSETEEAKEGFYRRERSFGTFSRSIALPENIKKDAITAEYSNGILVVKLPKIEKTTQAGPVSAKIPVR